VVGAGSQSASSPHIRRQRVITSGTVLLSACPTCSTAVTFGGGIRIVNGGRAPPARAESAACAVNTPAACQRS
jgi:hypothetical protein